MRTLKNISMWLAVILGGITVIGVGIIQVLEFFGVLFVDMIDIPETMEIVLTVTWLCFGAAVLAFFVHYHLDKKVR